MSGGDDKPAPAAPTSTTVTNVNIPEWLKGPTLDVVGRAKTLYDTPIRGYEEGVPADQRLGRIAGFDPAQTAAFSGITGMGAPQGFQDSASALGAAQSNVMALRDPTQYAGADRALTGLQTQVGRMGDPSQYADANRALDMGQGRVASMQDPQEYANAIRMMGGLGGQIANMQDPSQYADANRALDTSQNMLQQMGDPRAYTNAAGAFDRAQRGITGLTDPREFNIAGRAMMGDLDYDTGRFGARQADFYMNPYAQRVLDVSARQQTETSAREAAKLAARSASMGQFGGYGQNVAEAIRQRTLSQDVGDLYTRGLGEAYDKAAALYGQDEARRIEAAKFRQGVAQGVSDLGARRQDAALARNRALLEAGAAQQGLGTERQKMELARADALRAMGMSQAEIGSRQQADALARSEAQRVLGMSSAELADKRQQGNLARQELLRSYGMSQAEIGSKQQADALARQNLMRDLAVTRADLGSKRQADALARNEILRTLGLTQSEVGIAQQRANLERLTAQSEVGKQRQALEQYKKDIAYQDYLRQRDLPMEKLKFYSDIVRGISPNLGSTAMTYAQQPSPAASILGAGLTGLGIFNQLRS